VRLLPRWDDIDAWRTSLPGDRQGKLNNPREVEREYNEHRKKIGDPDPKKPRPKGGGGPKKPTWLEQMEALEGQVLLAQERAERESEYFAAMAQEVAKAAKMDDDDVAELRARVRAKHEAEQDDDED
jgi:hypothetical protein